MAVALKYAASLSLFYLGHIAFLLCDRGVPFMYRPYQWCMIKSVDLDPDFKVWSKPEVQP